MASELLKSDPRYDIPFFNASHRILTRSRPRWGTTDFKDQSLRVHVDKLQDADHSWQVSPAG